MKEELALSKTKILKSCHNGKLAGSWPVTSLRDRPDMRQAASHKQISIVQSWFALGLT
jgi:hypothetical protein